MRALHKTARRKHRGSIMLSALMSLALSLATFVTPVAASEGEHEYGLTVGGGLVPAGGALQSRVGTQYIYSVGDLWSLGAVAHLLVDTDLKVSAGAFAEGRVIIDALTWVPSLTAGLGYQSSAWMIRASAELAWRPSRAAAYYVRITGEGGAGPLSTGVEVGYRWIRGAASGLDF